LRTIRGVLLITPALLVRVRVGAAVVIVIEPLRFVVPKDVVPTVDVSPPPATRAPLNVPAPEVKDVTVVAWSDVAPEEIVNPLDPLIEPEVRFVTVVP